jgi:KipI family sensor histidine kinase inhibitor
LPEPRHLADGALLLALPNAQALDLAAALQARPPPGLLDAIPGAETLLVLFDPDRFDPAALDRVQAEARPAAPRTVRLRTCYDGPDLQALSRETGISAPELARLHAAAEHTVSFLGFAPGFAYLKGAPQALAVPRLRTPRVRVPAGSVAVADGYSGIYPAETPGGWRLIGRVAERMFDPSASPPSLLRPRDRVIFEPVPAGELGALPVVPPPSAPGEKVLRVLSPGPFTSVQGGPRHGLGAYGVPAGGAMDLASLAAANALVGNPAHAAGLELTISGPELEALAPLRIALSGGTARDLRPGERFKAGAIGRGARAYLAVEGGLAQERPGEPVRALRRDDELARAAGHAPEGPVPPLPRSGVEVIEVRALPGPQADAFAQPEHFFQAEYRLSPQSDRRGLRLQGPPLAAARRPDIPPEGTAPGAVQVPGDGLPIVLGPDRPVTGGYAKIATVIWSDLPLLAQARPGARIRFRQVDLAQALAARRSGR